MSEQNCKTIAGTIFCCVLVLSVASCTMYQSMLQLEQDKLQEQRTNTFMAPQPNALKQLGEEHKRWSRM